MRRLRFWSSTVLLALVAVAFPLGVVAFWAGSTIYDSDSFSQRAVELLNSPAVRRQLSLRLTEQLARSGNQQALAFRPAVELAIEAVADTDTFRSIFRTAIRRTHQALLEGRSGADGLDLSDSVAIITASLQLPSNAAPGQSTNTFGQSLADVTARAADFHIWELEDLVAVVALVGLVGSALLAALSVALSVDRRRTVARIGWIVLADGAVLAALLLAVQLYVGRMIADPALSDAVREAVSTGTADLNTAALWIMGYGIVIAAAAGAMGDRGRLTPSEVRRRFAAWMQRRRATTGGTVLLGLLGLLVGLLFIQDPLGNLSLLVVLAGLWLTYLSVVELVGLIRRRAEAASSGTMISGRRRRWRQVVAFGCVAMLVVGLLVLGLVITTKRAAQRAEAQPIEKCNGEASLCDLPLNMVMFPGSHNSMASALYPGWLFAEQLSTIKDQLNAGVRALLIDTYYGVPSSSRLPGSETPIVLTDRAAGLSQPPGQDLDPAVVARANQLASRAPKAANAKRAIYLCHNYCELGAYPFASALADVKQFLDTNPDEVVVLDIQDATSPADTVDAIVKAGLGDRTATLVPGEPLPTLGELIRADHRLLVFAEEGGTGVPAWYHQTYRWFQETPFSFKHVEDFSCGPNRGDATAPLLLVNHWVSEGGLANPTAAATANQRSALEARLQQCLQERELIPNVVAVDFAGRGDLVATVAELNQQLLKLLNRMKEYAQEARASTSTTLPATTVPGAPATPAPATTAPPPVAASPPPTLAPITTLTGGEPEAFCAAITDGIGPLYAWAVAGSSEPPSEAGRADLAFAPTLVRHLTPYLAAAPEEMAVIARPILARAQAAVAVLMGLGLDDVAIDAQASLADERSAQGTALDALSVEDELLTALADKLPKVGVAGVQAAARSFAAANPQPPELYELGDVSGEVAQASGYGCIVDAVGKPTGAS